LEKNGRSEGVLKKLGELYFLLFDFDRSENYLKEAFEKNKDSIEIVYLYS
jgi:hypothetical protein